jgi:hypothetical protein
MKEITFNADCQICDRKNTPCRMHHLIPMRLIKILPMRKAKYWKLQTLKVCNSCNNHLHPENKLYEQIKVLKEQLGYRISEQQEASEYE